ncbi:AMP-binding protein [Pseudomonas gingeri]|uniref:AMP-binding protein n=1 Tax=Pseudomonas gingeri TaxID=117681 RepID=UPI0015A39E55|nr:AMP-binding protein [Pseudomonas gingeri]NWA28756.1 AMP-binding protein [Pseudomonas gingeri]NWD66402.1 AMP-binding protein [Pseudomonas gingeri]
MNIAHWLDQAGALYPKRPALFEGRQQVANYGAFVDLVRYRAAYLINEHGIAPGDRVALFMKNCCEYLELLYAIWWAGAVAVPIDCKLHPVEAGWIVGNADARLIFTDGGQVFAPERLPLGCLELDREDMGALTCVTPPPDTPCPRHIDDLAWLFYTSDTTDSCKGVMLSHGNLTDMSQGCSPAVTAINTDEAVVYAAPMSHCAGLYNLIHVRQAARHVVPESRDFKADELLELASGFSNITLFVAPAMFTCMVEQARREGYDGKGINTIIYGDAPIYPTELRNVLLKNNYGELLKTELRLWLKASANDATVP